VEDSYACARIKRADDGRSLSSSTQLSDTVTYFVDPPLTTTTTAAPVGGELLSPDWTEVAGEWTIALVALSVVAATILLKKRDG